MSDKTADDERELPSDIEERLKHLGVKELAWARGVSREELLYLLDQCPFLQIVSTGKDEAFADPQFVEAKSGWTIHDYGNAMSSSPGKYLFSSADFRSLFTKINADAESAGKGTIVKQAHDTAAEMITLAQQKGWRGVNVVDGHPLMVWAAWMKAEAESFPFEGFNPSAEDEAKRERAKRTDVEDQMKVGAKPAKRQG